MATKTYRIDIILDEKQQKLVEWMTKEDFYGSNGNFRETLKREFYLQLREDMDIYAAEAGIED